MTEKLHNQAIVIDGLIISNWSRALFEQMREGGLTAANCTCSVWEDFEDTMANVATWKRWFAEHDDLLLQVHTTADIERAKNEGKVGIFLGWQNTSGIDANIDYLRVFRDLGVRVMQMTYNLRNRVGFGCWEKEDRGLTDFGHDVVDQMNELGILVDLSHVGAQTSDDTIRHSKKPVAYTHCCPSGLYDHPRNKTDDQLRFIADRGGFVGVATYPPFMKWGADSTLEHCLEIIEYMINIAGEDNVGIGTDFTQDQDVDFFRYLRTDPATAQACVPGEVTVAPLPKGFDTVAKYPNLTGAMERAGWSDDRIRKIIGGNWMRLLGEVWGA